MFATLPKPLLRVAQLFVPIDENGYDKKKLWENPNPYFYANSIGIIVCVLIFKITPIDTFWNLVDQFFLFLFGFLWGGATLAMLMDTLGFDYDEIEKKLNKRHSDDD